MRWFIKIPLKIMLARIPLSHKMWNRLGVFRHGQMQDYAYALQVFSGHLAWAGLSDKRKNVGKVAMELGPGESLFSALLAKAHAFKGSLLLDVGTFALPNIEVYQAFAHWLADKGLSCPDLDDCASIQDMLSRLGSEFLDGGLSSLRSLPDESVDFVFSQAVLEHIRRSDFEEILGEIQRILKPGGVSTHVVDFRDHLEYSINNLRFSDRLWEADWFAPSSGFYTNRLRLGEMVELIRKQGFRVEVVNKTQWDALPLPREKLDARFRVMADEELIVLGAVLRCYK